MTSSKWPPSVDIIYREFYDVPRIFVFLLEDRWFLMDSPFDDTADEYPDYYVLYELPDDFVVPSGSWEGLPQVAVRALGRVPLDSVVFDASRRKSIATSTFRGLI